MKEGEKEEGGKEKKENNICSPPQGPPGRASAERSAGVAPRRGLPGGASAERSEGGNGFAIANRRSRRRRPAPGIVIFCFF